MIKKPTYQIPFDKEGNMLDYEHWYTEYMEDPQTFKDTLEYDCCWRGRSAATFIWKSITTGKKYPMFMHCMDQLLKSKQIAGNRVTGTFTMIKRGANYSIMLVEEPC